jgi:hypothetical protein
MEAFGYEQLPQDYNEDDGNDDADYYEQHEQDHEGNLREASDDNIMQAGKPEPVKFEITEDVNIPEGRQSATLVKVHLWQMLRNLMSDEAEFIKNIMSRIQLPKPGK